MKSSWMQALGRRRLCQSVTAGSPRTRFQERVSARCGWVRYKPCTFLTPRQLPEATGNTVSLLSRQHLPLLAPWGRYAPSTAHPLYSKVLGQPSWRQKLPPHPHQTILSSPGVSVSTEEPEPSGQTFSSPCPTTDISSPATAYSDGGRKQGIKKSSVWHKRSCWELSTH